MDSDVIEMTMNYPWPGNVRQLRHMIEAGVSIADKNEEFLSWKHLPKYLLEKEDSRESKADKGRKSSSINLSEYKNSSAVVYSERDVLAANVGDRQESGLLEEIRETERNDIIEAIKRNNGNVAKAANELGMSRQKLYYRIKKYNI